MTDPQAQVQERQEQQPPLSRRLVAEVVGTFFLVLAALLSPKGTTFALVGATLLVMVIILGKVSGSQLNPAVTVGLVSARQFPLKDGLLYIVAQIIGAFLAFEFGRVVGRSLPTTDPHANAVWFEGIGTALLVFSVTRVVMSKLPPGTSAVAIGTSLAVGIAIAGPSGGGVLNPAIAVVLLSTNLASGTLLNDLGLLVFPLIAGVLAALLARYLLPPTMPEAVESHVAVLHPSALRDDPEGH